MGGCDHIYIYICTLYILHITIHFLGSCRNAQLDDTQAVRVLKNHSLVHKWLGSQKANANGDSPYSLSLLEPVLRTL